jgi:hypothetical protein
MMMSHVGIGNLPSVISRLYVPAATAGIISNTALSTFGLFSALAAVKTFWITTSSTSMPSDLLSIPGVMEFVLSVRARTKAILMVRLLVYEYVRRIIYYTIGHIKKQVPKMSSLAEPVLPQRATLINKKSKIFCLAFFFFISHF